MTEFNGNRDFWQKSSFAMKRGAGTPCRKWKRMIKKSNNATANPCSCAMLQSHPPRRQSPTTAAAAARSPRRRSQKADSTRRSSQAVPHPNTNRALRRLTSEVRKNPVHSTRYGRQRRMAHKANVRGTPRIQTSAGGGIFLRPAPSVEFESNIWSGAGCGIVTAHATR